MDNFPCVWTLTRFSDMRRVAIGFAEVTPAQSALINADTRIRSINLPDGWESQSFSNLSGAQQTAVLNFLNNRGVDTAGISGATTLPDLIELLAHRFRPSRPGRNVGHLKSQLSMLFGVN